MNNPPPASEAERRLKQLAWLLDNSIPLPGGYRIGIDGLLGLIPGAGDALGGLLGAYIVFEARRLGAPRGLLLRMAVNVAIDAVVSAVPLLGDLFDFAFKANSRNVALLSAHIRNPSAQRGKNRLAVAGFAVLLIAVMAVVVAVPVIAVLGVARLLS